MMRLLSAKKNFPTEVQLKGIVLLDVSAWSLTVIQRWESLIKVGRAACKVSFAVLIQWECARCYVGMGNGRKSNHNLGSKEMQWTCDKTTPLPRRCFTNT